MRRTPSRADVVPPSPGESPPLCERALVGMKETPSWWVPLGVSCRRRSQASVVDSKGDSPKCHFPSSSGEHCRFPGLLLDCPAATRLLHTRTEDVV